MAITRKGGKKGKGKGKGVMRSTSKAFTNYRKVKGSGKGKGAMKKGKGKGGKGASPMKKGKGKGKKGGKKGKKGKGKGKKMSVEDLDAQLEKYMGPEASKTRMDDELDAYFKKDD